MALFTFGVPSPNQPPVMARDSGRLHLAARELRTFLVITNGSWLWPLAVGPNVKMVGVGVGHPGFEVEFDP